MKKTKSPKGLRSIRPKKSKSVRRRSRSIRRRSRRRSRSVRSRSRSRSRRRSRRRSRSVRSRSRSIRRRSRRRSRSRVRIPVTKGLLEGYHLTELARDRRALLMRMIKAKQATYSDIIKRLNVLVIYNKNRNPEISDKVFRDLSYMQKHVPDIYKLSPVSRSRTTSPYKFTKKKSSKKGGARMSMKSRSKKRSMKRSIRKKSMRKKSRKMKW